MSVRPKTYDRPGYREQSMKRREIDRIHDTEMQETEAEYLARMEQRPCNQAFINSEEATQ